MRVAFNSVRADFTMGYRTYMVKIESKKKYDEV